MNVNCASPGRLPWVRRSRFSKLHYMQATRGGFVVTDLIVSAIVASDGV